MDTESGCIGAYLNECSSSGRTFTTLTVKIYDMRGKAHQQVTRVLALNL